MRPNIYIGKVDKSAMYRKWYYEVIIDHIEVVTHLEPHFRVGWANTRGMAFSSTSDPHFDLSFRSKAMFLIQVEAPNGAVMVLEMTAIHLDSMAQTFGTPVDPILFDLCPKISHICRKMM